MNASQKSYKFVLFCLFLLLLLIGCGQAESTNSLMPSSADGYPNSVEIRDMAAEGYPVPTSNPEGRSIGLDKPIRKGDTVVSGFGPAGVPIRIVNITFMGEELGAGIIDDDGTFSIDVAPISEGIRIGLLANLDSVNLTNDDVIPGDGAINIPQVGYFIDSFVIK
ncbi:MAG: hypothetical protein IPJ90_00390 [Anaerolineaceae bacterium]|nr:hypothetical protein [Anaerolineaceae bacterium]